MARNGQMSRNGQDPIFGGDISPMNSNEEPLGTPDPQPQTINLVSSSLPSPLATRKRKSSDSPEYDQDHRVPTKRFFEDGYPNTSMAIRLLVVFNYLTFTNPVNEERKGSECDVRSLDTTFSELGYKIALNEDLSYEETFNHLKKIQELCNGGGIHTIVLAFMSHGDGRDPDHFLTRDGKSVSMSQVRNLFSNKNCEGLWGKPKLFLGIFCRNKANHEDVLQSSLAIEPERSQSDPHSLENNDAEYDLEIEEAVQLVTRFKNDDLGDMTTIYASKPGTASYRDPRRGTIMVQCLCRVLDKHGQTHPLNDLYRFLQQDMEAKQTGASSEYSFSPDRDDLELKTYFFADI